MRENYVLGREFWVEGGPVMKLSFDEELTGPHGPMAVRFYYPTDEALAGKEAQSPTTPVIVLSLIHIFSPRAQLPRTCLTSCH